MYLKIFAINALKYMTLIQLTFYQQQDQHGKHVKKKIEVELELLTDIDMLLMIGKGITGGMSCNIQICKNKQ